MWQFWPTKKGLKQCLEKGNREGRAMDWCIDAPVGVGNDPGNSTPSEASESLLVWGGDEWQSSEMSKKLLKIVNICFVAQTFLELRLCRRYTCNILRSCAICLANSGTNTVHIISHYLPFIGNSYGSFFQAPKQKAVFQSFVFYFHLYAAIWRYQN